MSKNSADKAKRRAKRKSKQGGAAAASNAVPLFGDRSPRIRFDEFHEWILTEIPSINDVATNGLVSHARTVVEAVTQVEPHFDPTAWRPDDVDAIVGFIEYLKRQPNLDPDAAIAHGYAVHTLFRYLVDTDLWRGDAADTDYAANQLASLVGLEYQTTSIEPVDEATERAALLATRPIQRLLTLLEWLGPRRPTTPSRWLKPADARDLAQRLDIPVPHNFRSMSTFAPLLHLWEHAQVLGLVEANTSSARPGAAANIWAAEPPIEVLRIALATWVRSNFPQEVNMEPGFASSLVSVVISAIGESPITVSQVDDWEWKLELHPVIMDAIRDRLDDFIAEGWLRLDDDRYIVDTALRPAVLSGLPISGPDKPVARGFTGVLTLDVELQWMPRPVWRRIRVNASLPLDEFHRVLQTAFGWENCHLHDFEAEGVRFVPEETIAYGDADDAVPEHMATLGEVLHAVGDTMTYRYDFGDGWHHVITVRETTDTDDDILTEVLDGAGMTPFEDVGGPPGWDEFIIAINDPKHPRHKELREWSGLRGPLDPDAFDVAAVNRWFR